MVHVSYAVGTNRFHSIMMRCASEICDKGGSGSECLFGVSRSVVFRCRDPWEDELVAASPKSHSQFDCLVLLRILVVTALTAVLHKRGLYDRNWKHLSFLSRVTRLDPET